MRFRLSVFLSVCLSVRELLLNWKFRDLLFSYMAVLCSNSMSFRVILRQYLTFGDAGFYVPPLNAQHPSPGSRFGLIFLKKKCVKQT